MTAALAAWLALLVVAAAFTFARRPRLPPPLSLSPPGPALDVVILRPCAGAEPELARCLASWPIRQGGPSPRVIFAVGARGDAALPAAAAAARGLSERGVDARVLITGARAPNHKAAQLAVAAASATARRADVLVVADSDVDLEGFDLDALVGPVAADARVAACWAPPVEHGAARTLGDRASQAVLGASLHAFPLVARLRGRGMVGKLCAVRRSSLAAAGGFAALVDVLCEDVELARRFWWRGEHVAATATPARSLASGRTLAAVLARYVRWIVVVRHQRPRALASYPLVVAATPLLALLALLAGAPAIALGAVALRVLVALLAQRACGRPRSLPRAIVESALSDALLLAAFARALTAREVMWRGARLRVLAKGRLMNQSPVAGAPAVAPPAAPAAHDGAPP